MKECVERTIGVCLIRSEYMIDDRKFLILFLKMTKEQYFCIYCSWVDESPIGSYLIVVT